MIYRTTLAEDLPIDLDCGHRLGPIKVAYQTFGQRLNVDRDNAVLICHAFTGDQFPIGQNPVREISQKQMFLGQRSLTNFLTTLGKGPDISDSQLARRTVAKQDLARYPQLDTFYECIADRVNT
jgi:hypothetical protein